MDRSGRPDRCRVLMSRECAERIRGVAEAYNFESFNKTLRQLIGWYGKMGEKRGERMVNGYCWTKVVQGVGAGIVLGALELARASFRWWKRS